MTNELIAHTGRQGPDTIWQLIDFIDYTDHLKEQYYQEQDEDVF